MVQSDVRESDPGAKPTLDWSSGENAVCYAKGKSHWMQTVAQFPRQRQVLVNRTFFMAERTGTVLRHLISR